MERKYVDVVALHDTNGNIRPLFIIWSNGVKYKIDKVVQRCQAASLKCGGAGIRYTCIFNQQRRYLFLDNDKWFIESVD